MQEDTHLTEDSLRQALSRLGAGGERSDVSKKPNDSTAPIRSGAVSRSGQSFSGRRRRFVSDDHVLVERPLQSRFSQNRGARPSHNSEERDELERLRQAMRQEKRRNRDAEAEVEALKTRLRNLETRLAHFRIQADERGKELQAQQEETLRAKAELRNALTTEKPPVKRRNASQKPLSVAPQEVEGKEPQPVQWWKD